MSGRTATGPSIDPGVALALIDRLDPAAMSADDILALTRLSVNARRAAMLIESLPLVRDDPAHARRVERGIACAESEMAEAVEALRP